MNNIKEIKKDCKNKHEIVVINKKEKKKSKNFMKVIKKGYKNKHQ